MSSNTARSLRLVDASDLDAPSEREISGVHANAVGTTAKIPKAQLDLLRAMRDEAEAHTHDDPTVMARIPNLAFEAVEAELALDEAPEVPESTVVMRYPAIPAIPDLPRIVAPPPFTPIVGVPQSTRLQVAPEAFEAARVARELARQEQVRRSRTKWLVIGIWAAAFGLAGSLAWAVAHEHRSQSPATVVSE